MSSGNPRLEYSQVVTTWWIRRLRPSTHGDPLQRYRSARVLISRRLCLFERRELTLTLASCRFPPLSTAFHPGACHVPSHRETRRLPAFKPHLRVPRLKAGSKPFNPITRRPPSRSRPLCPWGVGYKWRAGVDCWSWGRYCKDRPIT